MKSSDHQLRLLVYSHYLQGLQLHPWWLARISEPSTVGIYGYFRKWWYPQITHFNRVFHYKPSILGYPYFWKHPYKPPYLDGWILPHLLRPPLISRSRSRSRAKDVPVTTLPVQLPSDPRWLGKGQLGVPLTMYPRYFLCFLGILGDYNL